MAAKVYCQESAHDLEGKSRRGLVEIAEKYDKLASGCGAGM